MSINPRLCTRLSQMLISYFQGIARLSNLLLTSNTAWLHFYLQRAGDRLLSCCNWSIHSFSRPMRGVHFCYERINFQLRILSTSSIRNQYTNKNGLLDLCWCKCCTLLSQYRVPTTFPQSDLLIIIVYYHFKKFGPSNSSSSEQIWSWNFTES